MSEAVALLREIHLARLQRLVGLWLGRSGDLNEVGLVLLRRAIVATVGDLRDFGCEREALGMVRTIRGHIELDAPGGAEEPV